MVKHLNKVAEDFESYNENWYTEEEETRDIEEERQKEILFVNPCTFV